MTQVIKSKYPKVIEYMRQYQEENYRPPTMREIQKACQISTLSIVAYFFRKGIENGDLVMIGKKGDTRNYRVVDA